MPRQTVHVRSADELRALSAVVAEMVYGEMPGGQLDVVVHSGRYTGQPLSLNARRSPVDITLRGEGGPVFDGLPVQVVAREVSVSGLHFTGEYSRAALDLGGATSVQVEDVHFHRVLVTPQLRGGGARGAALNLEVLASGATLGLADTTMEEVSVAGSTLVYLWMPPGKSIAGATIQDWKVRGAKVASLLKVGVVESLILDAPDVEVPPGGRLLDIHTARRIPTIRGGRVVVDSRGGLSSGAPPELDGVDLRLREGGD